MQRAAAFLHGVLAYDARRRDGDWEPWKEEQRELLHGVIVELMGEEYLRTAAAERGLLATQLVAHAAEARDYLQEARYALEVARKAGEVYAQSPYLTNLPLPVYIRCNALVFCQECVAPEW